MSCRRSNQRGFTLIELLIALSLMAVLAGLGWRGLDNLLRTREQTQTHVDQTAVLQTALAQWQADLQAVQAVPGMVEAGVSWDGRTLRLTRHATATRADGADAGLWVVAWTLRDNQWARWQSAPLQTRSALQQAWSQAERWGRNPSSEDAAFEVVVLPLDAWQLTYFRGNAWTHPLSSDGNTVGSARSSLPTAMPDAIRLQIDLPARTGMRGQLTLDWVRPHFSNIKS